MNKLDLIKRLRNRTLERVLEKYGEVAGDLKDMKLSIFELREILYYETKTLAESIVEEDFT